MEDAAGRNEDEAEAAGEEEEEEEEKAGVISSTIWRIVLRKSLSCVGFFSLTLPFLSPPFFTKIPKSGARSITTGKGKKARSATTGKGEKQVQLQVKRGKSKINQHWLGEEARSITAG